MNKKVVYTSLVGDYDILPEPKFIMKDWDYVCFSNNYKNKNSIWRIEPIPFKSRNNHILSRYAKILPHRVLKDYDYSLYIDANIEITGDLIEKRINELIKEHQILSQIPHPSRNCIYKEAQFCIELGMDRRHLIEKQIKFLKQEKYPENNGLFENGLIFRCHNNPQIITLNEDWWNIFLKYSKRDQLSLVFLLWKNGIHCEPFTPLGMSVRNIPSINYSFHKKTLYKSANSYIRRHINKYI